MTKESKKTKILAVGDIHGDTGLVKKLAAKAKKENVDLIIMAGDLTFFGEETKNIIKPFEKIKKPVLVVHGNHEPNETVEILTQIYSNARNLSGGYYLRDNVGIFGAGGGDVVQTTPDKEIFELLEKGHGKIKTSKKKIMVTHMHPYNSEAEFSGWPGSKAVSKAVKKFHPNVLISAHIHEAGGIEEKIGKTKVINVSRQAKIFEI